MKVIGLKILDEFCARHAGVRTPVNAWRSESEKAKWDTPQDIKDRYPSASILSDNRVVFNLKGNDYRLLVKVDYKRSIVLIKEIGTHADYDNWKL